MKNAKVTKVTENTGADNVVVTENVENMEVATFTRALENYFNTYGKQLIGLGKKERKDLLKKSDATEQYANWVERPSDIPTHYCKKVATTYKAPEAEKNRKTRGHLELQFDGKYWEVVAVLTADFAKTGEGESIKADMDALKSKGTAYYNVSSQSSERRHCEYLAKALSVYYKLAFSTITDIPTVDVKDLQNKGRRTEIYKFASKMVPESK
jgi:hypothetical protein